MSVTSFLPNPAKRGERVTVLGSGFSGVTHVDMDGDSDNHPIIVNDGEMSFRVPYGAATAHFFLDGTDDSGVDLAVNAQPVWYRSAYHNWEIALFDATVDSGDTYIETLTRPVSRSLTFPLNGIDECHFTMYLDDAQAGDIEELTRVVKVWRHIYDPVSGTTYDDPADTPCFAGPVASIVQRGADNQMDVVALSALWNVQFHFHLLNHLLKTNPDTSADYTTAELMWKLIDLINNAFGDDSYTGIAMGTLNDSSGVDPTPYFVPMGANTWSLLNDDLLQRPASPDIVPEYVDSYTGNTIMRFNTDDKRGDDRSNSPGIEWQYHTGGRNLSDVQKTVQPQPGQMANYVWVTGAGGPNTGLVGKAQKSGNVPYGIGKVGVRMLKVDLSELKLLSQIFALARDTLVKSSKPVYNYGVANVAHRPPYYGPHYTVGDIVKMSADRGALNFSNLRQRIYTTTLNMSDNNVETAQNLVADDFDSALAVTSGEGF